jgi:hypothetical protein
MTGPGPGPGPDGGSQPPPYPGHWQYQDPYAAPQQPPPQAFPYAGPQQYIPVLPMQPVYGYRQETNGLATASMVLGIISIPAVILVFFDLPIAIVGLILGIVGLRRANRMPRTMQVGQGKAIAGIACASVGLVLSALFSVYVISELNRCSQYSPDSVAWERCYYNELE